MERDVQKFQGVIQGKDKDIEELKKKLEALTKQIQQLEKMKFDFESKIAILTSDVDKRQKQLETTRKEVEEFKQRNSELQVELLRVNNLLETLLKVYYYVIIIQESDTLVSKYNQVSTPVI